MPTPGLKWQGDGKAAKAPGVLEMERDLGLPEAVRDYPGGASGGYGPYAVVRFCTTGDYDLGWFTEIEDAAYGCLMGFRIYFNEIGDA